MKSEFDLLGTAILDYQLGNHSEKLWTETNISEKEEMPVKYLFRSYNEMPLLEKEALGLAKGRVLEIGCGAASHGLYLQNEKNLEVTSVDISPNAIEACKLRGKKNVICQDFREITGTYDTILLLMNGVGLCGRIKKMNAFLQRLKSLLKPQGQILMDSSDIIYMFDQNEDGRYDVPLYHDYYGELDYIIKYKGREEGPFPWLYIDFDTLKEYALFNGFNCDLINKGEHYNYLVRLTLLL